jgi:hypothetical protein
MRTPAWCRHRASELGPGVTELVTSLLTEPLLARLRAAQGILALADKHGAQRLNAACGRALAAGDPSYRTVKGILALGVETVGAPPRHPRSPVAVGRRGRRW